MKTLLFIAAALAALATAAGASAHVIAGGTSLSARGAPALGFKAGAQVVLTGRLASATRFCTNGRSVRLVTARGAAVASARTDARGNVAFVLRPRNDLRLRIVFGGSLQSSYGHSHRCRASSSRLLTLDVKR